MAIARLTLADMAADSGVLLGIILVRSSFAIRYFPSDPVGPTFGEPGARFISARPKPMVARFPVATLARGWWQYSRALLRSRG